MGYRSWFAFTKKMSLKKKFSISGRRKKNLKVSNRIIMKPLHENYTFQDKMVPKRKSR